MKPKPTTVSNIVRRFHDTGTVSDRRRSGRPPTVSSEENVTVVLASLEKSPIRSQRKLAAEFDISQSSVCTILKKYKYHPYKIHLLHELEPGDFDRRLDFCDWAQGQVDQDDNFPHQIIFSDEATFHLSGAVNRHNSRYYSTENPHWSQEHYSQRDPKVNVWAAIWDNKIIGPYFIDGNLTGLKYLDLLQNVVLPPILNEVDNFRPWFQQDGAGPHFAIIVRNWLNDNFPDRWIGRSGPVAWPPRSPDLSPLDFFFWGYLKSRVYINRPRTLVELKDAIVRETATISAGMLSNVLREFEARIGHCVVAGGQQFENLIK